MYKTDYLIWMHRITNDLSEKPCDFQNEPIDKIYTFFQGQDWGKKSEKTFTCTGTSNGWDRHNS